MPGSSGPILVTRGEEGTAEREGLATRHPDLAYVFGPTIRALYGVGCLALDLLTPLQILDLFPGQELLLLPPLVLVFGALAYLEYRLYRRIWPASRGRKRVEVPGVRRM